MYTRSVAQPNGTLALCLKKTLLFSIFFFFFMLLGCIDWPLRKPTVRIFWLFNLAETKWDILPIKFYKSWIENKRWMVKSILVFFAFTSKTAINIHDLKPKENRKTIKYNVWEKTIQSEEISRGTFFLSMDGYIELSKTYLWKRRNTPHKINVPATRNHPMSTKLQPRTIMHTVRMTNMKSY